MIPKTWKMRCMVLFMIMPLCHLNAQLLLKMTEITSGGKVFEIKPVFRVIGNDSILKKYPNVDINSSIRIGINREQIIKAANNWISVKTNLPVARIKGISEILSKRLDLINAIRFTSLNLEEERKELEKFSDQIGPLLGVINELEDANPLKIGVIKIFSVRNLSAADKYNRIFDLLEAEISSIENEYKSSIEKNKVFFRLGTFVNNTPVHLEGFDSYKEGDYYFVPPFVSNVPEDQKQDFEKYRKIASKANEDALTALTEILQDMIEPILDSLKSEIKDKFSEPLISFESAMANLEKISDEVKPEIDQDREEITKFVASVDLLITYAKDVKRPDYVKNLAESIIQAYNDFQVLDESLKKSVERLKNLGIAGDFNTALTDLNTSYSAGKKVISEEINSVRLFFDSKNQLQINLTEKISESLLKLGDEVSKLPLDNIPDQTTLDLKRTVYRQDGDRLIFKAVLTKSSPENDKQEEKTIDYTSIGLYQIGLHNSIQAVLILADNLSGQFESKKQFQFDPSYSVLFKWGNRRSSFYNDFVEFGFGLNMATLDFNNDNTPEVGIGLVFSAFKDYLQAGYGRNFGSDQNYWFFGIRLPFLGVNFNGKPKVVPADQ